jgi:ApaG protein
MFEALTQGIRVQVRSAYMPEQSRPQDDYYIFSYRVRLTNEGEAPTQLISRHWIITDADGQVQEVRGQGVVGQQPRLAPGESFEYESFCPLPTPLGSMQGSYQMLEDGGGVFEAQIPVFTLAIPQRLN